ncbi:MAG: TonB family protein [Verrucomicrobiae bacterium]|nr:TonB family protein [Verrucomicrobiae bacterium]
MDRTLQRCLLGSAAAHVTVLLAAILMGALAAKKALQLEVPVLEILPSDLNLTMGTQAGGGTPNPLPQGARDIAGNPPPRAQTAPASAPAPAPPPQAPAPTVPKVQEPPPTPVAKNPPARPSEPKDTSAREPAVKDPPADSSKASKAPKIELAKDARRVAQDVDATRLADKPVKIASAKPVEVNSARRRRTEEDARAATEAIEAAASAQRARDQRLAGVQSLADRIAGAATGVSKNVGASTQIQALGPGGTAYAPYYSYLQATLKLQWRKPATSSEENAQVTVQLVIAKDGALISADISRRSGMAALDTSIEELFRRVRKFKPLPKEFDEPRMVVPVTFVLESNLSQ